MQLRINQLKASSDASAIILKYKLAYLAGEVRSGKTITALNVAHLLQYSSVLFITKKKAISSIKKDYAAMKYNYKLEVINYESMHTLTGTFDFLILDEAHGLGSFPKPNNKVRHIKKHFAHLPMLLMSGTPTPESYSQLFHQLYCSNYSPFAQFKNFYSWAKDYVNITHIDFGFGKVADYSKANKEMIDNATKHLFVYTTQQDAGFQCVINEHLHYVEMKHSTYTVIKRLKADKVIDSPSGVILADTAVKEMMKVHQLCSGTIKFEDGNSKVFDYSKAEYIKEKFTGKIAIFYKFKAEYEALKSIYGDSLTDNLEEFYNSDKSIALQIVSGREGVNLSAANCLVFYNIDFSAVSYFQARDRMSIQSRLENNVHWIFAKGGIENKIYNVVKNKKNFTSKYYERVANTI
jgi:SNF2-related domain